MKKLLKKNGMYLQSKLENGRLNLIHTENIDDATLFPEEDVVVLQKYFNCTVVDVPPKWGIFYNKRVNPTYAEKQQLVKINSTLMGNCITFRHVEYGHEPLLFDTHDDAVNYGKLTRKFLGLNEEELLFVELQVV